MKRKCLTILLTLTIVSGIMGCGQGDENSAKKDNAPISLGVKDNGDGTVTATVAEYPMAEKLDGTLAGGINQFAYDMADTILAKDESRNDNYVFSPYSICSALTLLNNAALGETQNQINLTMGISSLEEWNKQLQKYMNQPSVGDALLRSANSLWLSDDYTPADRFYDTYYPLVDFYFDAELFSADFDGKPEETTEQMNQWISDATEGMIEDFIDMVDPSTVLSMVNAVYFDGKWKLPFTANATYEQTFHGAKGESKVWMMHQGETYFAYYEDEETGLKGISLPYGEGETKVMNILLPLADDEAVSNVGELFYALDGKTKTGLLDKVMNADKQLIATLALPKFSMEYTIEDLPGKLQQMGIIDAFDPISADLSYIGEDIYVSDASHMAKIEVDELGTKAAAVTEICTKESAMMIENYIEFIVDRPFIFTIQDKESGMILFMGQVNEL